MACSWLFPVIQISVTVSCVHENCFHVYVLTIIDQSCFLFGSQLKIHLLFIINSVSCFKVSSTSLGWSKWKQNILGPLIRIIFSSIIIMTWLNCYNLLVILLRWYKRYNICWISFFNFYKLFPAFICANDIGSLVNSLFRVNINNPFPSFNSSSWPYSSGMSVNL